MTNARRSATVTAVPEAVARMRAALADGADWFDALLDAVSVWEAPEEYVNGRRYRYLIGGEAFDWLLLAERLLDDLDGAVPAEQREALLFFGRPPRPLDDADFRRAIGDAKHSAHLNFVYGVVVEEALQLTVEEEVLKERRSCVWMTRESLEHQVFERIYGHSRDDLLDMYRTQADLPGADSMSYAELLDFTYWLFKYRVNQHDPARVASDTRKAMIQLSYLEAAARRRVNASGAVSGEVVEGEVVAHLR
jgi:hypothetical protein